MKERNEQPNAILEGEKLSVSLSVSAGSLGTKALTASFVRRNKNQYNNLGQDSLA